MDRGPALGLRADRDQDVSEAHVREHPRAEPGFTR
jgi:hypothetical protein